MGKKIKDLGLHTNRLKVMFLFSLVFLTSHIYCQKKTNFFIDYGLGVQIIGGKIKDASYSAFGPYTGPHLFLGFGAEYKINKSTKMCLRLNANQSMTETYFNYYNDSDKASYMENSWHKDINYGLAFGIRYSPRLWNDKLSIHTGINFQKLTLFVEGSDATISTSNDSFSLYHINTSNDFSRNYNSLLYYMNLGFRYGKKKKSNLIFEFNTTLNKPIFSSDQYYYNYELVENSSYKVNMMFLVIKIQRNF